jgi:molecular chaperone GrpE
LKLIEQLLPVVDNFERALSSSKDTKDFEALVKGLDMTFRQLDNLLAQEGLTPIEAVGQPFNPEFHQAIMQVESEEHEEGIVVEEIQKGYLLKDKVVRPAMVKVSV